jgi:hypothetical protein
MQSDLAPRVSAAMSLWEWCDVGDPDGSRLTCGFGCFLFPGERCATIGRSMSQE